MLLARDQAVGDEPPPRPIPPSGHILIGPDRVPFWLPLGVTPAMIRVRDVGPPRGAV